MKKKNKKTLILGVSFIAIFVLWTLLVCVVDVKAIGPCESCVGFATLNGYIHNLIGVNMPLYVITDWLGIFPILVALGFAILGIVQLINRKSLCKVDYSIITLGLFYIVVITVYIFFELVVINYRPTLIDGYLESSYPSSTTLLVMCIMPTAALQLHMRIKSKIFRQCAIGAITFFVVFMVVCRCLSGVHWISDIIGSIIFSTGIVLIYYSINNKDKTSNI